MSTRKISLVRRLLSDCGEEAPAVMALVLNYCSYEDTLECVAALQNQDYPSCEILVIDNASPDHSGERLREQFAGTDTRFLQNAANLGYAGGNNVGIRHASSAGAAYVFIVNPDVRVSPSCLHRLIRQLEWSETRAAAMPLQFSDENATEIDRRTAEGLLSPAGVDGYAAGFRSSDWVALPTLYGAAIVLSLDALNKVGSFDPLYFCYSEEQDLCRRLRYHGYEVGIVPSASVLHERAYERGMETPERLRFREYLRLRNSFLYNLKDPGMPLWRAAVRVAFGFLRSILGSIWRGNGNRLGDSFRALGWLLSNAPALIYRRWRDKHRPLRD